ncbi:MAG: pentapeptide repeat-containing protein [Rhodospirillaceae bacterium]|nr:pentapeptide repeat-containing protein [Rhodospirillaceae bacterium]
MSDFLTPITARFPSPPSSRTALSDYNALGLNSQGQSPTGDSRNIIVDQISLSAAAQAIVAAGVGAAFPARAQGVAQFAQGATTYVNVDLSGAVFLGQNLDGAVFSNVILKDVNFSSTSLRGARFDASLLVGARFERADLTGADLSGAQGLVYGQIQGAIFDATTRFPAGIGNPILGTFTGT